VGGAAQSSQLVGGARGRKGVPRGDVREAYQGMHQGQLPRMIELQTGDAFAVREDVGCLRLRSWPRSRKFQDVLLNIQ